MVSRATSVYIIMLVVFAAGLWTILSFGSILLRAPTDLSGKWELRDPSGQAGAGPAHTMTIEQSGLYVRMTIDRTAYSLKLAGAPPNRFHADPAQARLELVGNSTGAEDVKLTLDGQRDSDEYELSFSGPLNGMWRAVRVARTYPKRQAEQSSAAKQHARL